MHELSIVFTIADRVREIAEKNNAAHVESVTLQIGEVSSVVNSYLEDCWQWNAARTPLLKDCRLIIEPIPAVTLCEDCQQLYHTVQHGRICPYCGSKSTYLIQGNETNIKSIAVTE